MKNFERYIWLIIILVSLICIIILVARKPIQKPIPVGQVLVAQSMLDSIQGLANKPPEIIVKDSIIHAKPIILHDTLPVPVYIDSTGLRGYVNKIKTDSADVTVYDIVRGELIDQQIEVKPIVFKRDSIIKVFIPQLVEVPVEVRKTAISGGGIIGGDAGSFKFGPWLDVTTKKNMVYGVQYLTDTDWKGAVFVKFGVKF